MAVTKEGLGSRCMIQLLIINLVGCFAWLSGLALAQLELSDAVTGSVSFPDVGITCIGNLAVFFTSLLRGRLDLEIGARDVLATKRGPKLKDIDGFGLTTCSTGEYQDAVVVILSNRFDTPHSSITPFMKYVSHAHGVDSILLHYMRLDCAVVSVNICKSEFSELCGCIVFWTVEEITIMLADRMPGTLKRLSDSVCLLPSWHCLRNGCHGCDQGLLHVENGRLIEGESRVESLASACEILRDKSVLFPQRTCICIPMRPADDDVWTKLLIRCFRTKDKEARGFRDLVPDELEKYIAHSEESSGKEIEDNYNTASLIVPRFIEVLVNVVLTCWFKVDGFSSSLVGRRVIKDYIVDNTGTRFATTVFVKRALVRLSDDKTNVCQVLTFRGSLVNVRSLSYVVGFVNLICSISWGVLIALEGSVGKWYDIHSMPPSKSRVAVIMAAIGAAVGMDLLELYWNRRGRLYLNKIETRMVWGVIVLEIGCIVTGIVGLGIKKRIGRWVYSALQGLVWFKWGIGSYLLGDRDYGVECDRPLHLVLLDGPSRYLRRLKLKFNCGIMVYSSAFMLNAILAGVRGKWEYTS